MKEVFELSDDESARLCERDTAQNKAAQQQTGEQIVAGDGVRNGVSGHAGSSTGQLGVKKRIAREERLFIIQWQTGIAIALSHGMTGQM